jgi:hypothetical protein
LTQEIAKEPYKFDFADNRQEYDENVIGMRSRIFDENKAFPVAN